jgi:hypothetical protein
MKSLVVVEYTKGENGLPDKLVEVARHYQITWATAVAEVDTNTYLESDAEGNLMVLMRDPNGVTEEDRKRLNVSSEMLLGEMVNKIRRIDVLTASDAVVVPRAFVGTVSLPYSSPLSTNTCADNMIGRGLNLPLRLNSAHTPRPPHDVAIQPWRPRERTRRHGLPQVPRFQERG